IPAAIVTGAIVLPLCIWGTKRIELLPYSEALLFLWMVIAFFLPVLLSTVDMKDCAKQWRKVGLFRSMLKRGDLKQFYFPAWIRMGVLFISAVVASLILKAFGVNL
ncbi:MAG: hypothetical protein ACK4UN_17645, partial [Limisphaerales bacterium]